MVYASQKAQKYGLAGQVSEQAGWKAFATARSSSQPDLAGLALEGIAGKPDVGVTVTSATRSGVDKARGNDLSTDINSVHSETRSQSQDNSRKSARQLMAWAKEKSTGKLTFIGELPRERTGLKCGCVCYGCGEVLQAVNAGNNQAIVTPYFRHEEKPEMGVCGTAVARVLLRSQLELLQDIHLPARSTVASVQGLSGKRYTATRLLPPRTLRFHAVVVSSDVEAVLRLDDGTQLVVRLRGTLETGDAGALVPTVSIVCDDPLLATLNREQLRKRLSLLIGEGQWSGPGTYGALTQEAQHEAREAAIRALDLVPEKAVPEIGRTPAPETLLHWTAKEILSEVAELDVPGFRIPWKDSYSRAGLMEQDCEVRPTTLDLSNIRLEKTVGRTRPDVLAEAHGKPAAIWNGPLAIEVTVANRIDAERIARIEAENVASLEVDLSADSRSLSYDLLRAILVSSSERKQWLFHPGISALKQQIASRLAAGPLTATSRELGARFEQLFIAYSNHPHNLGTGAPKDLGLEILEKELHQVGKELEKRGYAGADLKSNRGHLNRPLQRLFSLKLKTVIGYRLDTVWQVVNTFFSDMDNSHSRRFHIHYLLALQAYKPQLESRDAPSRVREWRNRVAKDCKSPHGQYFPDTRFNDFLALLFPEIRDGLQWRPRN